jgi:hypothetical protein
VKRFLPQHSGTRWHEEHATTVFAPCLPPVRAPHLPTGVAMKKQKGLGSHRGASAQGRQGNAQGPNPLLLVFSCGLCAERVCVLCTLLSLSRRGSPLRAPERSPPPWANSPRHDLGKYSRPTCPPYHSEALVLNHVFPNIPKTVGTRHMHRSGPTKCSTDGEGQGGLVAWPRWRPWGPPGAVRLTPRMKLAGTTRLACSFH